MKKDAIFHRDLTKVYPIITHGEGASLYDENGKRYLDGSSGAVAANLGHSNDDIVAAMSEQAKKVGFVHTLRFETEALQELASAITELAPLNMNKVYFTSGGSEANESALKLARQLHRDKGEASKMINIGRWQSYHGNTMGSLSVGGDVRRRYPYTPQMNRTVHVDPPIYPLNATQLGKETIDAKCVNQLERIIKEYGSEQISAFIVEPIVGSQQGAIVPTNIYFEGIRRLCNKYDIYLIVDEVMTGFYRTGLPFAIEYYGIEPDIITFGKGVSAGYIPLGGMIVHNRLIDELLMNSKGQFIHGYTYSGHPVSVATGKEVLTQYKVQRVEENVAKISTLIKQFLTELKNQTHSIAEIRGLGLLIGIEFRNMETGEFFLPEHDFAKKLNDLAIENGAIFYPGSGGIDGTLGEHILLAPPLNITEEEVYEMLDIFKQSLLILEERFFKPIKE